MFMKPKRVKTELKMVQRKGDIKITQGHLDKLNRNILRDCQKAERSRIYRGD